MVIKTVYRFVDFNMGVEITLGTEGFSWGTRGRGKLYRLTVKWTSSKTVAKGFLYTWSVPSTACFNSIALHQKWVFSRISFSLDHSFRFMRHNSSPLFHLKLYMLSTKRAHQIANFKTCDCFHENNQITYVIFQTTSHFFFKYCTNL